jgi:hypothetical protein
VLPNTSRFTTRDFGDSFSRYGEITFLLADSPEEMQRMLRELRIAYEIVSMYAQGTKHVAWINAARPIVKKTKIKD